MGAGIKRWHRMTCVECGGKFTFFCSDFGAKHARFCEKCKKQHEAQNKAEYRSMRKRVERTTKRKSTLEEKIRGALLKGVSYGYYVAMMDGMTRLA